jgi:hypothetical protein
MVYLIVAMQPGLFKTNNINGRITLTVITISGTYCISFYNFTVLVVAKLF